MPTDIKRHRFLADRSVLSGIALIFFFISMGAAAEKPSWEVEWRRTVEAAKKEGQVTLYGSSAPMLIADSGVFQKAYPEIKVVKVSVRGSSEALERLMAERRAGQYLADLFLGGSTTILELHRARGLDPIKPALILPEVLDESKWLGGAHAYLDPDAKYVFIYIAHPQTGSVHYNTKLVDPKQFHSFWDYVNPKWKGKIEMRDIRTGGTGSSNAKFFYYHPELGPKFLRRLFSEMQMTLFRDNRQSVDWLATGRFAMCFFCYPQETAKAQKQGLPIDEIKQMMKEGAGLTSHSGQIGLINRAARPNAAKVFVNWLLSRDGQMTLQRVYSEGRRGASNSRRIDIPKDMIPQEDRLVEGVEYLDVETPERRDMGPVIKIFEEALAQAEKKR